MKVLVISDYFYNQKRSRDEIEYVKWNNSKKLSSSLLGGYDSIIIDMTFENKESNPNKSRLLYELKMILEKPDYLSKKNLILVVVCGSPLEVFEYDKTYDEDAPDKVYEKQKFDSYDFLKIIIPDYMNRVDYGESNHIYPIAITPIGLYLNKYKSMSTFFNYEYDPDSEKCVDVTPLAKMKEKGNTCVAFECKSGRGLSVILPSYDVCDKQKAFLLLLKICRSYFKKREGIREIMNVEDAIPQAVREVFIEAILCFNYDLYTASMLLCRRALEESAIHMGASHKKFLRNKIEKLFKANKIDSSMHEISIEIIEFGNWGAHAGKYKDKQITEEDVLSVLDFLKIYFNQVYCLPEKLKLSMKRRQELKS